MRGLIDDLLPEVSKLSGPTGFIGLCIEAYNFVMAFSEVRFSGYDFWNLDPTVSKQPESLQFVSGKIFCKNPDIYFCQNIATSDRVSMSTSTMFLLFTDLTHPNKSHQQILSSSWIGNFGQ